MNSKFENQEDIFQEEIVKGKAIKIDKRIIYPVIQISTIQINGKFWFESILPIALAVIEPDNKYFIPLSEEKDEIKEWLENKGTWNELGIKID